VGNSDRDERFFRITTRPGLRHNGVVPFRSSFEELDDGVRVQGGGAVGGGDADRSGEVERGGDGVAQGG
jgi:hypothetical protein